LVVENTVPFVRVIKY